jgi:hypothetical protein
LADEGGLALRRIDVEALEGCVEGIGPAGIDAETGQLFSVHFLTPDFSRLPSSDGAKQG